jgi:signal peptidase I
MRARPPSHEKSLRVLLAVLIFSLLGAALLHRYVFAVYIIEGSSMWPTFKDGDTAMVNMLVRCLGPMERGEIVLVRDGQYHEYATKRIVGLPGERIDIRDNRVWVNGRPLEEGYLPKGAVTTSRRPTFVLGPRQYFVLGDNRSDSFDSRSYGPIRREAIMGSYTRTFWACR